MAAKDQLSLSLCDDGLLHGFPVFDDAILVTPMCGATVGPIRSTGDNDTEVCGACMPLIAVWAGLSPTAFRRRTGD